MTDAARPWLPANAMRDGVLDAALTVHATEWAARWFASPRTASIRRDEVRSPVRPASEALCWRHPCEGLLLALSPTAHVPIGAAMLGVETGAQKLSAQDHQVLRKLTAQCARDFLLSAAKLCGLAPLAEQTANMEAKSGFRFALSLGAATQLLDLFVDDNVATAARRTLAESTASALRPLGTRKEAVGRQTIRVGAMIGVGKLGLGELRSLACGDVLVLDRGPSDASDLAINGVAHPETHCSIVREDADLQMQINLERI